MKHATSSAAWNKVPLVLLLTGICFVSGCQKKNSNEVATPPVTVENLQTAIDRDARLSYTYSLFSEKAAKDREPNIAKLYKALARSQEIQMNLETALMKKMGYEPKSYKTDKVVVGTVLQTLHFSESDEEIETESMYPNLIRTAEIENLPDAVTLFKHCSDADQRHIELVKDALDNHGFIAKHTYYVCPCCGYIATSDTVTECPDCHERISNFEKI
jgi:rubrerythrin